MTGSSRDAWRQALGVLSRVACIFIIIVSVLLAVNAWRHSQIDPVQMPLVSYLKQQLQQDPGNAELQEQIRQLDFMLRKAVFDYYEMRALGGWLILIAAAVVVAAIALIEWLTPRNDEMPDPQRSARQLHYGPARVGLVVTALIAVVGFAVSYAIDDRLSGLEQVATDAPAPAKEDSEAADPSVSADEAALAAAAVPDEKVIATAGDIVAPSPWPGLRGPGGRAVVSGVQPPQQLSDDNKRWQTAMDLPGYSSPVICGDVVAITAGDESRQALFGFDKNNGKLLWSVDFPPPEGGEVAEVSDSGWCAPSPASDGRNIFAIAANGTCIAVSPQGELLWSFPFGIPHINYGIGSSLLVHDDLLYVQFDTNEGGVLTAIDTASGEERWAAYRVYAASWSSPLLFEHEEQTLVVVAADPAVAAYDALSGEETWVAEDVIYGEIGPSPASFGTKIVTCQEGSMMVCFDGRTGDELWRNEDIDLPDISSPAMSASRIYICMSYGLLLALNAENGEEVWEHSFDNGVQSSPIIIGTLVYLLDEKGGWHVFKDGSDAFEEVASSQIGGEGFLCTPAMEGERIYLRTNDFIAAFEK